MSSSTTADCLDHSASLYFSSSDSSFCRPNMPSPTQLSSSRKSLFSISLSSFCTILLLFTFLVLSSYPSSTTGLVTDGSLYSSSSWKFVAKFCFDAGSKDAEDAPRVLWNITAPPGHYLVLYYDLFDEWPNIYYGSQNCRDKIKPIKKDGEKSNIYFYSMEQVPVFTNRIGNNVPKWWYLVISNCDLSNSTDSPDRPLAVESYHLTFTNKPPKFQYHFSVNIHGVLETNITFFILYVFFLCLIAWMKTHAKEKGMQFKVHKILFVSVAFNILSLILNIAHGGRFSEDGKGIQKAEDAAYFFEFISLLILLGLVLDISQGWAVSTNFVAGRRWNFVFIFLFFVSYVALYVWQNYAMDPASTLYVYESPPGYAIIALRLLALVWCSYCLIQTVRIETDGSKQAFYVIWAFFALGWLLALPLIVLIAHFIASYRRQMVVTVIVNAVQCFMYCCVMYFFRPFRSNRYISVLNPDESRAFGSNHMQIFPEGPKFSTI